MTARTRKKPARGPFAWLPLGLWLAGVLALVRSAALAELVHMRADIAGASEEAIRAWELARAFPSTLLGGLVVGLLAAVLVHEAVILPRAVRGGSRLLAAFVFLAILTLFAGWFTEPEHERARLASGHLFSHLGVQAILAFAITGFLFHFMRANLLGLPSRRLLAGRLASLVALTVGVVAPLLWFWARESRSPRFTQNALAFDFLAAPESWNVIAAAEGAAPRLGIITPAAAAETDSGDKPALHCPPGSIVELEVPPRVGPCVLRAAAGVDRSVRGQMPGGIDSLEVEFEVALDGEPVFRESVRSERIREGVYTPEQWVWRHAGGAAGIAVQPGQKIRLATRILGPPAEVVLPPGYPRVGFGELRLEQPIERARTRATPDAPNVVLVLMDTQRADRMSCYGCERPTTPHLDALAQRGTLFERAYSTASWTWPATASILTGLEPELHGVLSQERCTLQLCFDTLAEVLQERGYTTHAVSCNPLIAPERYFDQGFETFVAPPKIGFKKSDEVMPEVVRWVEAHAAVRFFLYLHLVDPHTPHAPHPEEVRRLGLAAPPGFPERGMDHYNALLQQSARPPDVDQIVPAEHQRWIRDQYDASVATGDRWLGELLTCLHELGLDDRTLVAFTADHGEELFDHGLLEHGHTLHDELVRVPLILAGPGIPAGRRVDRVVSNRHLATTIATRLGARLPQVGDPEDLLADEGSALAQFQTYKGAWRVDDGAGGTRFERMQRLSGLRRGEYVLHWREVDGREPLPEDVRLYESSLDPGESSDASAANPRETRTLLALSRKLLESQRAAAPEFPVGTSESVREMLLEIGYLHDDVEDEER